MRGMRVAYRVQPGMGLDSAPVEPMFAELKRYVRFGPDDARRRLCAALADSLRAVARRRSFTLVLDDLQWADAAMYQAKAAGRNTVRLHSPAG